LERIDLTQLLYNIKEQNQSSDVTRFFGHCLAEMDRSKSQNFQDIWALYENKFPLGPENFFVEFGATDGITGSNTWLMEKRYSWRGIVAEPNPAWHQELHKNRWCKTDTRCVHTHSGNTVPFIAAKAPDLSTIKGFEDSDYHSQARQNGEEIEVQTISLVDLLIDNGAPNFINYVSIDTEGSEYDILSAFFADPRHEKYYIKTMTIEHNFQSEMRDKIHYLMTNNGYNRKFEGFSRWDDFYIRGRA
jgi:FkbM family methyltransferase